MGKTVAGMIGKHGRETGRNRVGGRGYPRGPGGTVPAARGWRSADAPPCPVATAPGLGHAPGSGNRGSPLPHRATVGGLVPAGRGWRSVRPSWGWAWSTLLAHPRARSSSGRGSNQGDLHQGSGRPAVGGPAVRGTYRPKGIYGLLRWVRCRPKVPRPIHTKADLEAQEAWKKGAAAQPCGRRGYPPGTTWPGLTRCGSGWSVWCGGSGPLWG